MSAPRTDFRSVFVGTSVFLFIALSPIQDSFLQGTGLSSLGRGFSLFPLAFLFLLASVTWLTDGRFATSRLTLICVAYVLGTTVYGLAVFGLHSHGQDMLVKSISSSVPLIFVVFAVFGVPYNRPHIVRSAVFFAFALVAIGFLFGTLNFLGLKDVVENSFFHYSPNLGERPRSFAMESSQFSVEILGYGLLSLYYARSRVSRFIVAATLLALLVVSGSRGGILTVLLSLTIMLLIRKRRRWYQVLGSIVLAAPLAFLTSFLMPQLFPEDSLTQFTSVATRGGMVICSLLTAFHHPSGVGLSGFFPAIATYLPTSMEYLQDLVPVPLNFDELTAYITSPQNVGTKTFFFDQLIRFGVPFAVLFILWATTTIRTFARSDQRILCIAVVSMIVASITYIQPIGADVCPITIGVALSELRRHQDARRRQRFPLPPQSRRQGRYVATATGVATDRLHG